MRLAVLAAILLVPLAAAVGSVDVRDAAGDEVIWPGVAQLAPYTGAACDDPAGDLVRYLVASDGATLTASLVFRDPATALRCGTVPVPGLDVTRAAGIEFGGHEGPLKLWHYKHTLGPYENCVELGESFTCVETSAGAASWSVPLAGTGLVGQTFSPLAFATAGFSVQNQFLLSSYDDAAEREITL